MPYRTLLSLILIVGCGDDGSTGDSSESSSEADDGGSADGDSGSATADTSSSGGSASGDGSTSGGDADTGADSASGDSGNDDDCPPCVPPPSDDCVGMGPCGCGPYECPSYLPCSGGTCPDGEQCIFVGGSQVFSACGTSCESEDPCPEGADGDAMPVCAEDEGACVLDCGDGRTCPTGMECFGLNAREVCMWPG